MNRKSNRPLKRGAARVTCAFAVPLLFLAGVAVAQYADDGARQTLAGGWEPDWGYCAQGPSAASATRYDCRSYILSAGTPVPGNPYYNPSYDTQVECIAPAATAGGPAEWNGSATCTNYWYRANSSVCVANGGMWLTNVCRGRWRWNPEAPASNQANYRDNCTRCHNERYFPLSDLAVAESYVETGHKNMLRPVAPLGNTDPHYTTNAPWAGADGAVYATDSSGNPIDFTTGTITVGGVPKTLYWIFDGWIADAPRSLAEGGSYSCARCHTTGWSADATMLTVKQPYAMFGDYTGLFSTAGDGQPYTSWDEWGIHCSRCHGSQVALATPDVRHFPDIPGREAVGSLSTGATRTALCMDCHRQETGGAPYDASDPGGVLKVGPAHETVEFLSHWHGNLFLNSPHALLRRRRFAQINDKALYESYFKYDGEGWPLSGNAGGCTECHDVHRSTVEAANPDGGGIREECTTCHFKTLGAIRHPTGLGTPIESKFYPNVACVSCHMPDGLHLFRISVDEGYATFPTAALSATSNANTTPDGAVWVDLDHACGQCHGGGTIQATSEGTIAAGSKALAVADPSDFAAGERIEIAGAGAGGAALHTYIVSVAGSTLNLAGKATLAVGGRRGGAEPDPERRGLLRPDAARRLRGRDARRQAGGLLQLPPRQPEHAAGAVDASASTCTGSPANCNAYRWNWGDGTPDGAGLTTSHVYAAAGTYAITLTVTEYAIGSASLTLNVTVYSPDVPPVVNGTCASTPTPGSRR